MAGEREQSEGRHARGERESYGQQGRDDGPEGDQQDAEGEGYGGELGLLEVLGEQVTEPLPGTGLAELVDRDVRPLLLDPGHGVQDGLHPVGGGGRVALHPEGDQCVPAVLGGDRRCEVGHLAGPGDGRGELPRRRPPAVGLLRGHHDEFARPVAEAGVGQDLLGAGRVAGAVLRVRHLDHARRAADARGQDDEEKPAENGSLAMVCAPHTDTCREIEPHGVFAPWGECRTWHL